MDTKTGESGLEKFNILLEGVRGFLGLHPFMTLMQLEALLVLLKAHPKTLTMQQLRSNVMMTQGALSRSLRTLRDDMKLITLEVDRMDERQKVIKLTSKGRDLAMKVKGETL